MSLCSAAPGDQGIVRDILSAADCNVHSYAVAGYQALTGAGSPLPAALTAMLTVYVAVLGYRLLLGAGTTRLADTPLIAIEIGAILALTLNWSLFQTLVFDVSAEAPTQIAGIMSRPIREGAFDLSADPVAGLQSVYDELTNDETEFGKKAGPSALASRSRDAAAADSLRG